MVRVWYTIEAQDIIHRVSMYCIPLQFLCNKHVPKFVQLMKMSAYLSTYTATARFFAFCDILSSFAIPNILKNSRNYATHITKNLCIDTQV